MNFTTPQQYKLAIERILQNVINEIADEILEKLKKNIITYTYEYDYFPNVSYADGNGKPTYEFLDSWFIDKAKTIANQIVGEIFHDPMSMSEPSASQPYVHGNYRQGIDRRTFLADILNVSGVDSENDFGGKSRQPYFDITINWLNQNWDGMARRHLAKYGIK
jgi:hypothetical protein